MKNKKPYYIKEPFGLPFELTEKDKFKLLGTKEFYVGVCMPWPGNRLMWDVVENKDLLCPDLMAKARGIDVPLLIVEAKDEEEAVEKYKKEVPEVKNWKLWHGWKPA